MIMTEIVLDGVDEKQRKIAENEIKQIIINSNESSNIIDLFRITNNFEEAVQKLTGLNTYKAAHAYGTAVGKTIPLNKNGKLRYALVFDGKFFSEWNKNNKILRISTFLHELSHVITGYKRWLKIGQDEFFSSPKGKNGWLLHLAITVWEEYEADRFKFKVLKDIVDEIGGNITDNLTSGLADDLEEKIQDLSVCVNTLEKKD